MRPIRNPRRRSRKSGRPVGPVLIAVLIVCGFLTYLHKVAQARSGGSGGDPILRRFILAPAAHAVVSVRDWFDRDIAAVVYGPRLASENARLQSELATLTEQYREISDEADENVRLRALLGFQAHSMLTLLPAEVIAVKPSQARDMITLYCGSKDHVARLMPVITDTGALVGQVVDVTSNTCDVLLLTDDDSSAGAVVYPDQVGAKPVEGICQGERGPLLNLTYLPQDADIAPGEDVFTSGEGGVYPKGMLIGTLGSVSVDPAVGLKSASVTPAVDFGHLQDVFVVLAAPVSASTPVGGMQSP